MQLARILCVTDFFCLAYQSINQSKKFV